MTTPAQTGDQIGSTEQTGSADQTGSPERTTRLILGVALLVRLLVIVGAVRNNPPTWLFSRGIEMGLLANSLLHGHGFSSPFGPDTGPTAFIAPGYPTLVAGIFGLFGTCTLASAIVIMVLQALANVATIGLMMRIARAALNQRTAWIAGAFWALWPPLPWLPTIFWETCLSICALTGMVALALWSRRRRSAGTWLLLGALTGLIALVNPALLPSLLLILAWAAWQSRIPSKGPTSLAAPVESLALALAALLLVFCAWPIRNAVRFHAFIPLRSTVGFELWMGNRPGATGFLDESLFPSFNPAELASYVAKGELAYTRDKSDEARAYIFAHPGTFAALTARRVVRFWSGTGTRPGSPIYGLEATITSGLGFLGLGLLFKRRQFALACLFLLPMLAFPLPYYITHAEYRYRVVLDPLMTLLAAYAVTQLHRTAQPSGQPTAP